MPFPPDWLPVISCSGHFLFSIVYIWEVSLLLHLGGWKSPPATLYAEKAKYYLFPCSYSVGVRSRPSPSDTYPSHSKFCIEHKEILPRILYDSRDSSTGCTASGDTWWWTGHYKLGLVAGRSSDQLSRIIFTGCLKHSFEAWFLKPGKSGFPVSFQ